jgi:hypothetical protein
MQLPFEELEQFFRLHRSLLFYVNQKVRVTDEPVATPEAIVALPPETRYKVHNALQDHRELIDAFADENPFQFGEAEIDIIRSWKHLVSGTFYAFRQLKTYMVFLSTTEPVVAYGVLALFEPFEAFFGSHLPRMLKTTLLPFKGRIVYDGIVSAYNITFGPGIRRRLNQEYKVAKAIGGIITSLPPSTHPHLPVSATRTRTPSKKAVARSSGAASATAAHDRIVALTDEVCKKHLDDDYAALCRKMADILARKRPSPLVRGKPESWASGILRVIGWANFLNDPSKPGFLRMTDIDEFFGVSEATGGAKSAEIRRLLKIRRLDPEWNVPSRLAENLMAWLIQVNGLMVDARQEPREIQEEAFRKGLIPYIPADRQTGSAK